MTLASDKRFEVVCEDGQVRHGEPFTSITDAKTFSWWGHACLANHEIRVLREDDQ